MEIFRYFTTLIYYDILCTNTDHMTVYMKGYTGKNSSLKLDKKWMEDEKYIFTFIKCKK